MTHDTELMRIALTSIADTADSLLSNHAAELAEREVKNLVDIRTEARRLLKEGITDEETKGCEK